MNQKDLSVDLPPEIACIHRKWNVRSVAYRTMIAQFQKLHPSSDEWGTYKNVIPNIAAESFPAIREQALEAVFHFVQRCDTAQKTALEVIHSLLDTIPTNTKPRAKIMLEQIILEYVEIGCSRDVIDELLRTALINQMANVATTCIDIITKIISVFGPTAIDLAYVLETLPYLQEGEELEFRSATKALILEIYRWQGKESIRNVGQILNPSDLKDVMKRYEDAKQTSQLKPSRHVRKNSQIDDGSHKSEIPSSDRETDLLKQINDEFFRKLESLEWTERRDALMELRKVLESSNRLRSGNYESLLTALKKIITEDQCVIVVGLAIASITDIAKGLGQQFSPYAVPICRILLEKFVEKRQNITEQLRKALDVLITTTSFESLIKTINNFLGSKNPTIRFETIQLLSRMFKKTTRQTLRKPEFAVLYKSLVNCLQHGQLIIREKSFIALAVAFRIAGEGVLMPYLEKVDPAIRIRIKNYDLDQDFEEKYNEIKYRNVAKKELKNDDKPNIKKQNSLDSNLKEREKLEKERNEFISSTGNIKTETQAALLKNNNIKKMKQIRKSQSLLNYNKVTKHWSTSNSNVTLEKFYIHSESKNLIKNNIDVTNLQKGHRKKEHLKKYPYRKPHLELRKETSHVVKDKRKNKKIFAFKNKDTPNTTSKEFVESSDQIRNNIIMNVTKLSNNTIRPQVTNSQSLLDYSHKKESSKNNDQTLKCHNMQLNPPTKSLDVQVSNKETIKIENTSSACTQENSELSQPVQQSVQTLDPSKCGEGFIVLTENEVKKLLGLKRISAVNDDSFSILPDWTSKRSLFKRSYKIFQVSKGATDKETQTSLTPIESTIAITPEVGVMDLTKTVDVIPTQTAGVSIQEKGTDAHRIKRYNRGTQWVQHVQTEILDTKAWSKRETSSEWKELDQQKIQQSQQKEKMRSVIMKKIEYRQPSLKETRRQSTGNDRLHPKTDHASKRTMEINTFTVTRSDDISKNTSESLNLELNISGQEKNNNKHHRRRNHNHAGKDKRKKQQYSEAQNCEDVKSINSNNSKQIRKVKQKYMHEIMVRSNKETTECGQNDMSSQTLIRLKKIERTKHHSLTKGVPRRNESKSQGFKGYVSHKSDVSIRSNRKKTRRSTFTQKKSQFKFEHCIDNSSGSCKEGCNFLPLVAKSIMGKQYDERERKNNNARKKQHKHKSQRNNKRGNKLSNEADLKKSEHAINRSQKKCHSAGDKPQQHNFVADARDMDPETKEMVIKELLKVCDISQDTFQKMVRRKVSPTRPCIFGPKTGLLGQRVNDLSSTADQDNTDDRSSKEHKSCTIM